MYKVTRIQSRPNTSVEFWSENHSSIAEAHRTYRQENYTNTGKFLGKTEELSEDGLLRTIVATWQSEAAFEEFITDQRILNEFEIPGNQYMTANNIFTVSKSSETI